MAQKLIAVRRARADDVPAIVQTHDASWREAYGGLIPGMELERMIARRGADWWRRAIDGGSRILVLDYDDDIAGYASYGRNRMRSMPYLGEVFELYLRPEFIGLGFGRRLFDAVRRDLCERDLAPIVVWALEGNDRALDFYHAQGGRRVSQAPERFGAESRNRIAFAFED